MFQIRKQIKRLYLSSILGKLSLTGAWVAILAARGYSLVEIGIAETVFHIVSILFEIPSGVLADVFGRKKMLLVSAYVRLIGNIIMILSCNLPMVCMAIGFFALAYNCSSGSGDALTYDSMKKAGEEQRFEQYESNQMILFRICSGISTLFAGFALFIGHRIAYSTDVISTIIQILVLNSLTEFVPEKENGSKDIVCRIMDCFTQSFRFIVKKKKVTMLMFGNSFVGTFDTLLLFFLQAKLIEKGLSGYTLGIALLFMQMGGIWGAKWILYSKKISYKKIFFLTLGMVLSGILAEHSASVLIMALGGFVSSMGDDALQVRTNVKIQEMIPSEQRASLISIESFLFSVIMIVLSPLAGIFFSIW